MLTNQLIIFVLLPLPLSLSLSSGLLIFYRAPLHPSRILHFDIFLVQSFLSSYPHILLDTFTFHASLDEKNMIYNEKILSCIVCAVQCTLQTIFVLVSSIFLFHRKKNICERSYLDHSRYFNATQTKNARENLQKQLKYCAFRCRMRY